MIAEEEFAVQMQRPSLEVVQPAFGSSLSFRRFNDASPNGDPIWHYHPEIELVFIKNGNGKRHIGNHISYYTSGDLLLIGSNLPHYGFSDRLTARNTEMVIQFRQDFMGDHFFDTPELSKIGELLDRSKHGMIFKGTTKKEVGSLMDQMVVMNPFDRLIQTLRVLHIMAESSSYELLNAKKITVKANSQHRDRIKVIYDFVRDEFQREIPLEEIAEKTSMTVPSFCRYFKQQTGKTFTQFVNEFRVIHACKLLSETGRSIADICFECGFNNFSHFNKQFKQITEKSPSEYRNEFREVIIT